MPGFVPTKPEESYVWIAVTVFTTCGVWLIANGRQEQSLGAQIVGAMLVVAGIYYTVQYLRADKRRF